MISNEEKSGGGGGRKCRQQDVKEGKEISERKNDTGKAYC